MEDYNDKPTRFVSEFINFLTKALPIRSIPTFIELLVGCMLSSQGFVSEAYLASGCVKHWGSYYKWIEKGQWSWLNLSRQLICFILQQFPARWRFWVIDDTLVLRLSTKAPSSQMHYDHSHKGNRPNYVQGQCWVVLGCVVGGLSRLIGIPVLARLSKVSGNTTKLDIACTLIRAISSFFCKQDVLLLDCWYMKAKVILYALQHDLIVIGQARIDTALYFVPVKEAKRRGRPRKYGDKIERGDIQGMRKQYITAKLYGRKQRLRYCEITAVARFLNGRIVRAVWCEFELADGVWSKPRLLLCSHAEVSGVDVILGYARRYYIEPVFDDVKNRWGWKNAWQQTRQVLHRWTHLIFAAYALPKLLVLKLTDWKLDLNAIPWRQNQPMTAGLVRIWLCRVFSQFGIRAAWCAKTRKFTIPIPQINRGRHRKVDKAA